ncbi:MAG: ABC transporter ATP-binding protein, partial [Ruminococcaceae bacterium]|nr:ABC transporter ATP-binding protein [Oscillospiraceae bacterium]
MNIEVRDLRKSYGDGEICTKVLCGISCYIESGAVCCLLGPSGSGKSTLLNVLGGIDRADSGSIKIDGESIEKLSIRKLSEYRRSKLGFVFQFYNLIPNLTIRENIETGVLSNKPLPINELIETLGLTEHQHKFPHQVSGGQQQRAGIGRALIKNPDLLLCDEPTGALDFHTAKEVLGLLQKINRDYNTTMIIATHNAAIAGISHRVIKLHNGGIKDNYKNTKIQ